MQVLTYLLEKIGGDVGKAIAKPFLLVEYISLSGTFIAKNNLTRLKS